MYYYFEGKIYIFFKFSEGTQGEVKYLIYRKSCCLQFYSLLEYQVNTLIKNLRFCIDKSAKILVHTALHTEKCKETFTVKCKATFTVNVNKIYGKCKATFTVNVKQHLQ